MLHIVSIVLDIVGERELKRKFWGSILSVKGILIFAVITCFLASQIRCVHPRGHRAVLDLVLGCSLIAALAVGLMLGGAAILGWARWRIWIGTMLTAIGGIVTFFLLLLHVLLYSMDLDGLLMIQPGLDALLWLSFQLCFGPALFLAGIVLILRQRRLDRQSAAAPPAA
jgi:hypothetical protein